MKKILAYIFAIPFGLACLFVLLYPIIMGFMESTITGCIILGSIILFFAGLYSTVYLINENTY